MVLSTLEYKCSSTMEVLGEMGLLLTLVTIHDYSMCLFPQPQMPHHLSEPFLFVGGMLGWAGDRLRTVNNDRRFWRLL